MRPKSLILLTLALGCGLIASIGINQVLANRKTQTVVVSSETAPILVAKAEVGLGDPLKPELLNLEEWPKDKIPPGAIGKLPDAEGRRVRAKFYPGEPILEAKLFAKGESGVGATDLIPNGYRVVSVRVDAVSGGSSMILPGDRVDVLVHLQDRSAGVERTVTRTFLQNAKVFAVNEIFDRASDSETSIAARTISLLVTPAQAEIVTLANELGKIRLVMRSSKDELNTDTVGATAEQLLNPGAASPNQVAAASPTHAADLLKLLGHPKEAEQEPAPSAAWRMMLLEGKGIRQVEFADGNSGPAVPVEQQAPGSSSPTQNFGEDPAQQPQPDAVPTPLSNEEG